MKILCSLLAACCVSAALFISAEAAETPDISAAAAVLMDADSGRLLMELAPDEPRLIASTTKIMTAMLALEHCDPDMTVTVEPDWTGIEGSSMYLTPGQTLTVRELLQGLMLASGNDAAVALACIAAGSVGAFSELMNEKARELGCENTHFSNPNGLDGEEHYASARDLALMTRAALEDPRFRDIVSRTSAQIGENVYTNHNKLLGSCPGVFGVKTGYTAAAGRTLVSCCEREGVTLICVTLNDPEDWRDHEALYDWAYGAGALRDDLLEGSSWQVPVIGGTEEQVPVLPDRELPLFLLEGDTVNIVAQLPAFVYAEVSAGREAGKLRIYVNGAACAAVPLRYGEDVARAASVRSGWLADLRSFLERKIYTFS